jgi:hypothetical protein
MDSIAINYLSVVVGAVLAMIVGAIWYGPMFGKKWMEIVGVNESDMKKREEMQKKAGPLYLVQFVLTLFQVLVLAHLIADTTIVGGLERSIWIYAAFVMPTIAGSSMWTVDKREVKWARFLIQGGYQLVLFIIFGLLLQYWV